MIGTFSPIFPHKSRENGVVSMRSEKGLLLTNFINCYNRQEICGVWHVFMRCLELRSHDGKACDFSLLGKSPRPYKGREGKGKNCQRMTEHLQFPIPDYERRGQALIGDPESVSSQRRRKEKTLDPRLLMSRMTERSVGLRYAHPTDHTVIPDLIGNPESCSLPFHFLACRRQACI